MYIAITPCLAILLKLINKTMSVFFFYNWQNSECNLCKIFYTLPKEELRKVSNGNKFSNTSNMHILYVRSGHSLWIVLTWFDKLLYPVWISLIFSVHTFYSWKRRWWDFHSHSTVQSTNTRLTYDIVWFSFEGGKDTEVKLS